MSIAYGLSLEEATLGRSAEDYVTPLGTNLINKLLEIYSIVIPSSCAWSFFLFIIMSELDKQVVAFSERVFQCLIVLLRKKAS